MYVQSVATVNQSGLWNSLGIEARTQDGYHETFWQVTEIPLPPIIFDTEDNEVELFNILGFLSSRELHECWT